MNFSKFSLTVFSAVGDAYIVCAGVPEAHADHAEAATDCALEVNYRDSNILNILITADA